MVRKRVSPGINTISIKTAHSRTCCLWRILLIIYDLGRPKICAPVITPFIDINNTHSSIPHKVPRVQPILNSLLKNKAKKSKVGGPAVQHWELYLVTYDGAGSCEKKERIHV